MLDEAYRLTSRRALIRYEPTSVRTVVVPVAGSVEDSERDGICASDDV